MFCLVQQCRTLGIGGQHRIERACRSVGCFLRDIAQSCTARHFHRTLVWIQQADQHLHQRRFARAIAPDQAHAPAGRNRSRSLIENGATTKPHGNIVDRNHCGAPLAGEVDNPKRCVDAAVPRAIAFPRLAPHIAAGAGDTCRRMLDSREHYRNTLSPWL